MASFFHTFQLENQDKIFNHFLSLSRKIEREKLSRKIDNLKTRYSLFIKHFISIINTPTNRLLRKILDFSLQNVDDNNIKNQIKLQYIRQRLTQTKISSNKLKTRIRTKPESKFETPPIPLYSEDTFLNLSINQIAETITTIEHELFCKISSYELLNHNKTSKSPNLLNFARHFNFMGKWVASMIITTEDQTKQIEIAKKFIHLAKKLLKLNNYNGAVEIYCGFTHSCVQRLNFIWRNIPSKDLEIVNELEEFSSPLRNFKKYRDILLATILNGVYNQQPVIPYMATHLKDLTFAEDGNPDYISESINNIPASSSFYSDNENFHNKDINNNNDNNNNNINNNNNNSEVELKNQNEVTNINENLNEEKKKYINFEKHHLIGSIINQIISYQKFSYNFEIDDQVRRYFTKIWWLDSEDLSNFSFSIQPKLKLKNSTSSPKTSQDLGPEKPSRFSFRSISSHHLSSMMKTDVCILIIFIIFYIT